MVYFASHYSERQDKKLILLMEFSFMVCLQFHVSFIAIIEGKT